MPLHAVSSDVTTATIETNAGSPMASLAALVVPAGTGISITGTVIGAAHTTGDIFVASFAALLVNLGDGAEIRGMSIAPLHNAGTDADNWQFSFGVTAGLPNVSLDVLGDDKTVDWCASYESVQVTDEFTVTPDHTPDAIVFVGAVDALKNAEVTSNTITVTGIDDGASFLIAGGIAVIDGVDAGDSGTINNGQTLALRATSSPDNDFTTSVSWAVGTESGVWTITTRTVNDIIFGADTRAGHGGVAVNGNTITAGDASNEFTITDGYLVPAGDGLNASNYTLTLNSGDVLNIMVEADTYSVKADQLEIEAALDHIAANVNGGKTVRARAGTLLNPTANMLRNYAFTSEVVVTGEQGFKVSLSGQSGTLNIFNSAYITLKGFEVVGDGTPKSVMVSIQGPRTINSGCDGLKIHGVARDPLADYSLEDSYENNSAIRTVNSGGYPHSVFIRDCEVYDVRSGISATANHSVEITDNEIYRTYTDPINVQVQPLTTGLLQGTTNVSRNVVYDCVGRPSDEDNPHVDCVQFLNFNDIGHWQNVTVNQNIFFQTANARGNALQGIANFSGSASAQMEDMVCHGNIMLVDSAHGITITNLRGGSFVGNTCVRYDKDNPSTTIGLHLGGESISGTSAIVANNIAEVITLGHGYFHTSNNLEIGLGGAVHDYNAVFDGNGVGGFDAVADFPSVISQYAMKPNGPADFDGSGDASVGDAGALGTGFAAFGVLRNSGTGWSLDSAYVPLEQIPTVVTNLVELRSAFDAATGGDIIELAGGDYGDWSEGAQTFTSPVLVRARDGETPIFARMNFNTINGVVFDGIAVTDALRDGDPITEEMATFQNCQNLYFHDCEFYGEIAAAYDMRYDAMAIIDCNDITIDGCYYHHCNGAIGYSRGSNINLTHLRFDNVRHDCILIGGVSNVVVEAINFGQMITDPTNLGIHAGVLQFNDAGSDLPNSNVIIRNIKSLQDLEENFPVGGIFINAGTGSPNTDFLIENVLIHTRDADSITLHEGRDCVIRNCTVIASTADDAPTNTGILIDDSCDGVTIRECLAHAITVQTGAQNITLQNNIIADQELRDQDDFEGRLLFAPNNGDLATAKDFLPRPDSILIPNSSTKIGWGHSELVTGLRALMAVNQNAGADALRVDIDCQYTADVDGFVGEGDATFTVDWGDGSTPENLFQGSHTYADSGEFTVTLTVDKGGVIDTHTHILTVVSPQLINNTDLYVSDSSRHSLSGSDITAISFDGTPGQGIDLGNAPERYALNGLFIRVDLRPERGALTASGDIETGTAYILWAANRYQLSVSADRFAFGVHDGTSFKTLSLVRNELAADGVNLFDGAYHTVEAKWDGDIGEITLTVDDIHTRTLVTDIGRMPGYGGADNVYIGRPESDASDRAYKGDIRSIEMYSAPLRPLGYAAGEIMPKTGSDTGFQEQLTNWSVVDDGGDGIGQNLSRAPVLRRNNVDVTNGEYVLAFFSADILALPLAFTDRGRFFGSAFDFYFDFLGNGYFHAVVEDVNGNRIFNETPTTAETGFSIELGRMNMLMALNANGPGNILVQHGSTSIFQLSSNGLGNPVKLDYRNWDIGGISSNSRPVNMNFARCALWKPDTNPSSLPLQNIREDFFNIETGKLVDPIISIANYGIPIFDFYGPASVINQGLDQSGNENHFVMNGSVTDV
ncbi:PKD domain-containing protein [Kordiimonas sp. SCSIO 12610]|uniref:PKD domain-containing protein n=1 Tax=Kordiimonas sp. SCSIO 12610 TaxID=2829597 RepID=UPI00210D305B|nr:PKD domain-containing protein [Kordiimonas sp. SCSIO 12610]UTW56178.1 hypothetical protein KFF44_04580 [Kordiimonas sp. SCSIO 12610]